MPVIDYARVLDTARKNVYNDQTITKKNLEHLKNFLAAYEVRPARELLFIMQIKRVLRKSKDLKQEMHDSNKINQLFKEIKEERALNKNGRSLDRNLSPATIETCKNVAKKFARWLNNNETPAGFKDIKSNKKNQKRSLEPQDMLEWKEGEQIAQQTNSVQIRAALLTQLDAGFRPSEFIDLNYGDVEVLPDSVIFHVRDGKTGPRAVPCFRCAADFLNWYDKHPTKRKDSPLWVLESVKRSHRTMSEAAKNVERYSYYTLQKRFDLMFAKAGIDKPSDFYSLRHSSCRLDRMDNVPNDMAAERHGHSINFYINTYGRFSMEDTLNRMRNVYGKPEVKKISLVNEQCPRCKAINTPDASYCRVCGVPLTIETAAKNFQESQFLKERVDDFEQVAADILAKQWSQLMSDPRAFAAAMKAKAEEQKAKPKN